MRKNYTIDLFSFENDQLYFSLNDIELNRQFKPAGQMIADTDHFAFIYLLDAGDEYHDLRIPLPTWTALKHILQTKQNPMLQIGTEVLELTNFYEELEMLVYNIEANYNYGSEFVQAVEEHFQTILAD